MICCMVLKNAFYDSASVYKLKDTNQRVYVKDVLESLSAIMPSFLKNIVSIFSVLQQT